MRRRRKRRRRRTFKVKPEKKFPKIASINPHNAGLDEYSSSSSKLASLAILRLGSSSSFKSGKL